MKLSVVQAIFCLVPISLFAIDDLDQEMRAPRPDALSYPGSTPEIVTPFDTALLVQIQQCVCQLKNIIESQSACAPHVITGPIVITVPGSYCLANDVSGVIEIAVSGVALNLNGHQILGSLVVDQFLQNILITDGFVDSALLSDGITIGAGCDNVVISDVSIKNGVTGLNTGSLLGSTITNLTISRVIAESCFSNGFGLNECQAELVDCVALNNGGTGISCAGLSSIIIINAVRAFSNQGEGFAFADGLYKCVDSVAVSNGTVGFAAGGPNDPSNETSVTCERCYAISNGFASAPHAYGFYVGHYSSLVAYDCVAYENIFGFLVQNSADIEWVNCLAKKNAIDGFLINSFIGSPSPITGLVSHCISIENANTGFNVRELSTSSVRFTSNYAVDNQYIVSGKNVNYGALSSTSSGGIPIATNSTPFYWLYWNNSNANSWINVDGNN